jgi:hypothetical protein
MDVARNKIECLLLTWHGTLVCSMPDTAGACHKPMTNRDSLASACRLTFQTGLDLKFARLLPLPDSELAYESRTLGDGIANRAANGRGYNFPRAARFLCAPEKDFQLSWNRERAETWESFLPVPLELLVRLSDLSTRAWTDLANGDRIAGRDIVFKRDFRFSVGQLDIDLTKAYPTFFFQPGTVPLDESAESVFVIGRGDSIAAFASASEQVPPSQNRLWLRHAENDAADTFRRGHNSPPAVEITYPPELKSPEFLFHPPAFADRDDRSFFIKKSRGGRPRLGYWTSKVSLRRARHCY